jgi:Flp pilus assembly pilin Flp
MKIKNFHKTLNTQGAALVEYGLLVGLVAVVAITSVTLLGEQVDDVFGNVTSAIALDSNQGPAAVAPAPVASLASVTFTVGNRYPSGNPGQEIGWNTDRVDGTNGTTGTLLSQTNDTYEIVTVYTQGTNGEMRLYLGGDVSGDDFTGVSLTCSSGARSYDLANADNFTADYRAGDDVTFWLWQGLDTQMVVGEDVTCLVQ